jgi:hypothetical protein
MAGNCLRRESDDDLAIRINELATKATQVLQFLSFAIHQSRYPTPDGPEVPG